MRKYKELPEKLDDIERHFKVSAGPGAGKTTWLVGHVQHVLKISNRLNKTQKIGCITYTQVGAETIEKKVKSASGTERLDISTIHSFLYRNIIKPFAYLIEKDINGEDLFNVKELNGHIEHKPNCDRVSSWINNIGIRYNYLMDTKIKDDNGKVNRTKAFNVLLKFDWDIINDNVKCKLRGNYTWEEFWVKSKSEIKKYFFPTTQLSSYKNVYWKHGIMHHEDVLYFTHYIFSNYPRVIELLSNKFPYLFLDEFQDTTPLQSWIINKIAEKGSIIGVIGDPAQSIYEFAGAKRSDFENFTQPNIQEWGKSKNYRSSIEIINFLNLLRKDIDQKPKDDAIIGTFITIFVGDAQKSIEQVKKIDEENFAVLCRYNKDVNKLKLELKEVKGENLIDLLYLEDGTHKRPIFIHSLFKAYDFYENGKFKEAVGELKKYIKTSDLDGIGKRRIAIEILEYLKKNLDNSIEDIYNFWQKKLYKEFGIKIDSKLQGKEVHSYKFKDFLPFLAKQTKVSSKIRTIHQAKGDEFSNVLICLFDKTDKNGKIKKSVNNILVDYIINAKGNIGLDTEIGEETRIYYVALSRAKEQLFINIPTLNEDYRKELMQMNVIIKNVQ
jgi:DNA helicase-2/ATP-dependent DNA helicase PcrA